jgi:hypothetical protein
MTDQNTPDTAGSAGMGTGSDAGAPGEDAAPPLQPGDDATLAALLDPGTTTGGAVEDDPEMAAAAQEDRATGLLAAPGGSDADTPDFREPGAG